MFIVALGAGFMAGLAAASPDMYDTADEYIKEYKLFDIDIKSVIGLTEADCAAVEEILDAEYAAFTMQPGIVMDMILLQDSGSEFTSRVYGILDSSGQTQLNKINITEGRLPENPGECVIESVFGKYSDEDISLGDTLSLSSGNSDLDTLNEYMTETELTVVGICRSPMCIGIEGDSTNIGSGTIDLNVYTMTELFSMGDGIYTDLFIGLEQAENIGTFDEEYTELIDHVTDILKDLAEQRCKIRAAELKGEYQDSIDEAEKFIDILEATVQIEDELAEDSVKRALKVYEAEAAADESTLSVNGLSGITAQMMKDLQLILDAASYDPSLGSQYDLESSAVAGSESSMLLDDLKKQLEDAEEAVESLDNASWIIRTRDDLEGFSSYSSNVGKVSALARIFPVFFFVVALLVALTTMTRLVEERRTLIGTLKALGFSNGQILSEYLLFSTSASVTGCIIGLLIGFRLFPWAISSAYSMMYFLPETLTSFRWDIAAWVAPVTIVSILLATLWACWNEFYSMPAVLMIPKAPSAGKRIWLEHVGFLWRRISFTYKCTFRNLFRYKKRFIMTIIGVAGCSALLLTGFGVRDSVNDIVDKQFGEIYKYDLMFILNEEVPSDLSDDLLSVLEDDNRVSEYTTAFQEGGKLYAGNKKQDITIFVPSDLEDIDQFLTLRERRTGQNIDFSDNGVVLTEKICEEMGISRGDKITLEDSEGHSCEMTVAAITENYVSSWAYMTEKGYEEAFARKPEYTMLLCNVEEEDEDLISTVTADIMTDSRVLYGRSVYSLRTTFSESIKSINGVVYVLILAAGLLCIVVLYNLTNVNICERKKELATLRVLGFYKNETQNYIFRETNILSFLGSVVGIFVGIWLHSVVVKTVEVNHIMFGRDIKPLSYIYALGISVLFTLIVDLIMKKPINKTDMVEAMKAND